MRRRGPAARVALDVAGALKRGALVYGAGYAVWYQSLGVVDQLALPLGLTAAPWALPAIAVAAAFAPIVVKLVRRRTTKRLPATT